MPAGKCRTRPSNFARAPSTNRGQIEGLKFI